MRDLTTRLQEWRDAGLVTDDQIASITAYEAERGDAAPTVRDRRPLAAEAVGYVGAALAVGAIFLLFAEIWQELLVGGRLALVGLLTVLLFGGGTALRRIDRPPLQRLTSVLLSGGVAGVGWLTTIVAADVLDWADADVGLAIGVATTVVSVPLYLLRRRALPQLTVLVSASVLIGALLARPALEPSPAWVGLTFWTVGVVWLLLALGGWLQPTRVAAVVGGVVALVAVQVASFDDARTVLLLLGVATAAALIGLAIAAGGVHHLTVGAIGLFVLVPQLAFELFGDAIGAPATLLVVGLLLVLLAVGLGRARREVVPADTER